MAIRGMAAFSCQTDFLTYKATRATSHFDQARVSLFPSPLAPPGKIFAHQHLHHTLNFYTTVHADKHVLDLLQWGGDCTYWPWASICVLAGTDVLLCMQQAAVLDPDVS